MHHAKLSLTLSADALKLIRDTEAVYIADMEEEPDYDEARYRVACHLSEAEAGQPFQLTIDEAQALVDALTEALDSGMHDLTDEEDDVAHSLITDLDFLGWSGHPLVAPVFAWEVPEHTSPKHRRTGVAPS